MATILTPPARLFAILSLLFGGIIVALNPPLRSADEPAHFLRAYAIAGGEVVPLADARGRKGTFLPPLLAAEVTYFRDELYDTEASGYGEIMDEYFTSDEFAAASAGAAPVFVPYEGSEGYSPIPYLPYVAVAAVGRVLHLGFLPMLYLMRLAGLLTYTAIVAGAISALDFLQWPMVLIAMLPASLYARASVSEDGAAFSCALMVVALAAAAAARPADARPGARAVWMALCVLTKPPQIALVLLEAMTAPLSTLVRRWRTLAVVALPGVILLILWVGLVGSDVGGSWRMADATNPVEHYALLWRLGFIRDHPLRFPSMLIGSLTDDPVGLWQQVIGVLGWLTDPLHPVVYWALSVALASLVLDRIDLPRPLRIRIALVSAGAAILYVLLAAFVLFLAWSRLDVPQIDGLQGRYFEICLPLLALAGSAVLNVRLPPAALKTVGIVGSLIAGAGTIEAIVRHCWLSPPGI